MIKCAVFGCKNKFHSWDAVEYHYCGEMHMTCSYTCLHQIKQAVTCRIRQKHRDIVKATISPKYKDLTRLWR